MRHGADRPGPTEESTFCVAYRELAPGVLSYLRARGVEDPEGLTQEVFLALFPRLGDVRGGMKGIKSLVFCIAHARYVDEHRRRLAAPPTTGYHPAEDPRRSTSAEDQLLAVEASGNVKALLNDLKQDQQDVIALRIVADLSVETTAEIMGRTPGAIKQLQRRALCRLRKLRAPLGEDRSLRAKTTRSRTMGVPSMQCWPRQASRTIRSFGRCCCSFVGSGRPGSPRRHPR